MSGRIDGIEDWEGIGRACGYRAKNLAHRLGVSTRKLERHFRAHFRQAPRFWLDRLLVADAAALLRQGRQVQEVAALVGHASASSFSRAFQRLSGVPPSRLVVPDATTLAPDSRSSLLRLPFPAWAVVATDVSRR